MNMLHVIRTYYSLINDELWPFNVGSVLFKGLATRIISN